jgi:hypothetical protein
MKNIIIILLFLMPLNMWGTTYYVSPTGNNGAAGTIAAPWATWSHAFFTAEAGDTVYFRGGVYPIEVTNGDGIKVDARPGYDFMGHDGTRENPICFFNYPGEVPILDCAAATSTTGYNFGIRLQNVDFWHMKGLTIRNIWQKGANVICQAFVALNYTSLPATSNGIILENMTIHNVSGEAFEFDVTDSLWVYNCDAYNLCDSIHATLPGNFGTGFSTNQVSNDNGYTYMYGCRAWECSDNGFAGRAWGLVVWDNCWSFKNGRLSGDGHGWKLSSPNGIDRPYPDTMRIVRNSIASHNAATGITTNDANRFASRSFVYSSSVYHTGYNTNTASYGMTGYGNGFLIFNSSSTDEYEQHRIFRNNISYYGEFGDTWIGQSALYFHSNNSWDASVTVTDNDFLSLDYTEMLASRKSDGSLPDINFLKLVDGSDLIDAGTDVGLAYIGTAPDIGYAEYQIIDSTLTDILAFTLPTQTGAATINTTLHTVAIEVGYTADVTSLAPTITLSYGATIDPLSGVSQDFTSPVTYTVTALDETTEQEWTVTVTETTAVTSITVSGAGGATTITTEDGTLQMSAAVLPVDADNKDVTWSVINGTGQGTINAIGLLTATADGTVTVRATADDGSGIYDDQVIIITGQSGLVPSSKTVKYRGKILKR